MAIPANYNPYSMTDPYYAQVNPNSGAMPNSPQYINAYNPSMSMVNEMGGQIQGLNLDNTGLNAYAKEALRTGPSAWSQLAGSQQDALARQGMSQARAQTAAKQADAEASMKLRGGLDSGARERIARSGQQDYINAAQGIAGQKMTNKMQIGLNDEQNRISQLGALPGMEMSKFNADKDKVAMMGQAYQADNTAQQNNLNNMNNFNMNNYNSAMTAWAAGQQSNAVANSGKK